jgi:hypothetical protein
LVNPFSIVWQFWVVIAKPGLRQRIDYLIAILWVDIKINVFGITPPACEACQRKATAKHEAHTA